ncbi:hypothetical protein CCACVL1_10257 [Corchorus capsularis]|uniref:Uncharacterized protein n=1 Tax=Corchorus capsularis TaxID=210143 RepID=A0A1R3IRZ8_COCAP|nr:hypothetical protein CCACVL1_10257 [Corchorus capsularis]
MAQIEAAFKHKRNFELLAKQFARKYSDKLPLFSGSNRGESSEDNRKTEEQ